MEYYCPVHKSSYVSFTTNIEILVMPRGQGALNLKAIVHWALVGQSYIGNVMGSIGHNGTLRCQTPSDVYAPIVPV